LKDYEHGRHAVLLGMKDRVKAVATLPLHSPSPLVAPARQCPLSLIEEEKMPVTEENLNESGKGTEHLCANEGHGAGTEEAAARAQTTSSRDPDQGRIDLLSFCRSKPTSQDFQKSLLLKLLDVDMAELQQIAVTSGLNPNLEKAALAKMISNVYLKHLDDEGDADAQHEFSAEGQDNGEHSAKTHNSDGWDPHEDGMDSDEGQNAKAGTEGQYEGARSKVRLLPLCSRKKQLHCMAIRQLPRSGFAGVVIISQAAKSAATRCPVCQRASATHKWINLCTDYSMRQVVLS